MPAYWSGRPEQSANLARSGLEYLADGENAAQLHLVDGLASAQANDAASAREAIAAARAARDRDHHDELLEIGGEFGFSRAIPVLLRRASSCPRREPVRPTAELEAATGLYDGRAGPGRAAQPQVPAAGAHRPGHRSALGRARSNAAVAALDARARPCRPASARR